MFYDGQNLEAENEEEADLLIEAVRRLGNVKITENVDSHTVKVSKYTFIVQCGSLDWITITGSDDESDKKLYDLYIECGREPEESE